MGQEKQTVTINGIERSYAMHLPDNLKKDAPLVIVLHGYGGTINPAEYGMDGVSDKNGFAICYPQGEKDGRGTPSWNVGYPFQEDMKIDDVDFLCKLAGHLQAKYGLSRENTFCTGFSNGGEMCYLLASQRPDVFSAVAPIAGLTMEWLYKSAPCPTNPIPLFEVHGTMDKTSEWDGDLENAGGWGAYMSVPLAINFWVAANRCTGEVTDTLPRINNLESAHVVITHKFINGIHGNEVWLYEVVNGEHGWAGESLNTGEEVWKFFQKFLK
jgi:polyhydroxybutyrate depolymerase